MQNNSEPEEYKNRTKAERVRSLIKLSTYKLNKGETGKEELDEAWKLSTELLRYIRNTGSQGLPILSTSILFYNTDKWEKVNEYLSYPFGPKISSSGDNTLEGKELFMNDVDPINEDIIIHRLFDIVEKCKDGKPRRALFFFDENGPHKAPSYKEGPDQWYDFIEKMGLLPSVLKAWEYHTFDNKEGKWPLELKE
jgi:hypothetical protein